MVFSGTTFLFLFLPLLLLLYFCGRSIRWHNAILLIFSLLFYAWGEPVWVLGMIVVTLINWWLALMLQKVDDALTRKLLLTLAVIISLSLLFWFKYASFLFNTAAALFGSAVRMEAKHLPIGISFYTFQVLTYTVDVYRKKAAPQTNPLRALLYISCFPQLIAGPIVQYSDVAAELNERVTGSADFVSGMQRFVLGLAKKILLANICGEMLNATTLAGTGAELSFFGAWVSALLYSMQLYFDFSAYSDMAIGLGRVFGFHYKENFDHPYLAESITGFWRRWHMSLSGFFRDYVYIPLGGNRRGTARTILNLAIVWTLTGLWHGASWNFALWGVFYFVLLVTERFVLKKALDRIPVWLRRILTLMLVAIGWVIFYYTDFSAMLSHLAAMFGISGVNGLHRAPLWDDKLIVMLKRYTVLPLIMMFLCLPVKDWLSRFFRKTGRRAVWGGILGTATLSVLLVLSLIFLLGQTYNPFIYFRF